MTVLITYTGNKVGLASLLLQLQPQLKSDDDIYVFDSSEDHDGVDLAKLYGSTRCVIFVEYDWEDSDITALQAADESAKKNGQRYLLVLTEDCVISATFISNLKRCFKFKYNMYYPINLRPAYRQFPTEFNWYNPPTKKLTPNFEHFLDCYCVDRDIDLDSEVPFSSACFENETVVILNGA